MKKYSFDYLADVLDSLVYSVCEFAKTKCEYDHITAALKAGAIQLRRRHRMRAARRLRKTSASSHKTKGTR